MKPLDDIARLRNEYQARKHRFAGQNRYSWFNPATLFTIQQRQKAVLGALKKQGLNKVSNLSILELGCGGGEVLREFLLFGVPPCNLYGVDLLTDRLVRAYHSLPRSGFANADGQFLPFLSRSFDIVMQFTAFSSILEDQIRRNLAEEMRRVVKSDGLILWYDFWLNPTNSQTRGIRPTEIKHLFPDCQCEFYRITLAPPIARRLASISWGLCLFLEGMKIFNTHYLVVIRPQIVR
jgi:ubiquinone/menaquinone biosynthesis C-methylase UbiE